MPHLYKKSVHNLRNRPFAVFRQTHWQTETYSTKTFHKHIKKTDYSTKITETEIKLVYDNHEKYITTPEFNKLTAGNFPARLKQANLVRKTDFNDKLKSLNQKNNSNKTKNLLVENQFKKLQTFD